MVIMSAVACTENPITPIRGTVPLQQERHLVANDWHADGSGNFVNTLGNMGGMNSASQYTVYVLRNNVKTLISGGAIGFQGGKLWAETTRGILSVLFRVDSASSTTPFVLSNSVELVVVF